MGSEGKAGPVWYYYLDTEGILWHEGVEFDDPDLLTFFMKNMEKLSDGAFRVLCQGEECRIVPEDVPYVVRRVDITPKKIKLLFPGHYQETLDPKTLHVGKLNVLYARVRNGRFEARFNRTSYLDLAKHVQFDPKKKIYFLKIDNKNYPIKNA